MSPGSRSEPARRRRTANGLGGAGLRVLLAACLLASGSAPQAQTPPDLAERQRAGLDLRRPVALSLDWSTPDTPAQSDAVSALLARHGFTVERERVLAPGGRTLNHVLRARRTGTVSTAWLDAVWRSLAPLVQGQGELRWSVDATSEGVPR